MFHEWFNLLRRWSNLLSSWSFLGSWQEHLDFLFIFGNQLDKVSFEFFWVTNQFFAALWHPWEED